MVIKKYRTTDQLIKILKRKGVIINDENNARLLLEKYSYYSIINSYKWIFKKNRKYEKNVSFEQIYALYDFDKKLRNTLFKYLLDIETQIKVQEADLLTYKYGIDNYLQIKTFDYKKSSNKKMIKNVLNNIKSEIKRYYKENDAIKHYVNKYGFVPPWVLVKVLTFGITSKIYYLMKQEDRQAISKNYMVNDKLLIMLLKNLTVVRNICAHGNRLYDFRSKFKVELNNVEIYKYTDIYMVIKSMSIILNSEQINNLNIELYDIFKELKNIINDEFYIKIKKITGFYRDDNI